MKDFDGGYTLHHFKRAFLFAKNPVTMVTFAKNNLHTVAMAAADNKIYLANVSEEKCKLIAVLEGHTASVTGLTWTADNKHICTCSQDGFVRLWGASGWSCVQALEVGRPLSHCVGHPTDPDVILVSESPAETGGSNGKIPLK